MDGKVSSRRVSGVEVSGIGELGIGELTEYRVSEYRESVVGRTGRRRIGDRESELRISGGREGEFNVIVKEGCAKADG